METSLQSKDKTAYDRCSSSNSYKVDNLVGLDHCPIIIQCNPRMKVGRKLFCFEAFWSKEEECKEVV